MEASGDWNAAFDSFPQLRLPLAVMGYRITVTTMRPLQESLFQRMLVARMKNAEFTAIANTWTIEEFERILDGNETLKKTMWEITAHRALYESIGSVLMLLSSSPMEHFFKETGISLYDKGVETYIAGLRFSRAIGSLANQYRHLGEWKSSRHRGGNDRSRVTRLVDDPLRSDAASEFIARMCFKEYEEFESALLSCSDGIADPEIIVDGRIGLRRITMREAQSEEKE